MCDPLPACLLLRVLQENDRLLELLGHLDSERARMARERQEHLAELANLRTAGAATDAWCSAAGSKCIPSGGEVLSDPQKQRQQQEQAAQQRAMQLEGELALERQRRQQAEADFQELLSSMDLLHSPQSTAPSPAASISTSSFPGVSGPGTGWGHVQHAQRAAGQQQQWAAGPSILPAADEVARASRAEGSAHLHAAIQQLEQENEELRGDLQRSQERYSIATAATSSLQHIAQGLSSISAGSGGSPSGGSRAGQASVGMGGSAIRS